jgi:hypothetical protein
MNMPSNDIGFMSSKGPLKKVYRIGGRTLIVIDESLVNHLSIDENTWLEQQVIDNEIIMRIHSNCGKTKEDTQRGSS